MGIISAIAVIFGIAFFISLRLRLKSIAKDESDGDENLFWALVWAGRLAGLVALLGILGLIDGYIYPIPTPFHPPEAKLESLSGDSPLNRSDLPKIKDPQKSDPMKAARDGHESALSDFEKRNGY